MESSSTIESTDGKNALFLLGKKDATQWKPSRARAFATISEQLAYRKGYDSVHRPERVQTNPENFNNVTPVPHQRLGAKSNAHVGRDFEQIAHAYFASQGFDLQFQHSIRIGVGAFKKAHSFDLGCAQQNVLVECKSHRWTISGGVPSAKIATWNEAMYYFHLAPSLYRKFMFVLRHDSSKRGVTLAEFYLSACSHLIPMEVEFLEYDEAKGAIRTLTRK